MPPREIFLSAFISRIRVIIVPFFFLFLNIICSFSQITISRWVIGSAGNHASAGNLMISSTTGEAVVSTLSQSSIILTQGFHQPSVAGGTLIVNTIAKNARCLTAKDGEATASVLNGSPPYSFSWSPSGGNSNKATELTPGVYFLLVVDAMGREGRDTVVIGALADDACDVHVYSGFTPNEDGINDVWHIDGIKIFPDNTVTVFNRFGEKVWQVKGYDNSEKIFKGHAQNGNRLPDGTYFYIVELPGLETKRGYVQITR